MLNLEESRGCDQAALGGADFPAFLRRQHLERSQFERQARSGREHYLTRIGGQYSLLAMIDLTRTVRSSCARRGIMHGLATPHSNP
jgi:hypothetical protein